jgi:hypothetical protein
VKEIVEPGRAVLVDAVEQAPELAGEVGDVADLPERGQDRGVDGPHVIEEGGHIGGALHPLVRS